MQHFHATHSDLHYEMHKDLWQYLITNYDKPEGLSWFYSLIQIKSNFVKTCNITGKNNLGHYTPLKIGKMLFNSATGIPTGLIIGT